MVLLEKDDAREEEEEGILSKDAPPGEPLRENLKPASSGATLSRKKIVLSSDDDEE